MKVLAVVLLAGFLTTHAFGQTDSLGRYGLEFTGNFITYTTGGKFHQHEIAHNERSQLIIPAEGQISLGENFSISFDYYIWNVKRFGQLLTILNSEKKVLLELVYSSVPPSDTSFISVVKNRRREIFRIPLPKKELGILQWKKLSLSYDRKKMEIEVSTGDFSGKAPAVIDYAKDIHLTFGRGVDNETPALGLRDIRINSESKLLHYYPLDEVSGFLVHDNESGLHGRQEYGEWIAPKHFGWESYSSIPIKEYKPIISAIDTVSASLYFFDNNYSIIYQPETRHEELLQLHGSRTDRIHIGYLDIARSKMYAMFGSPGEISVYDMKKRTFTPILNSEEEEWKYFGSVILHDTEEDKLYRFGGYGWYRTNNELYIYNHKTKLWERIAYTGDFIEPRTVTFSGKGPYPGTFWLTLGQGNEDGDQRKGWFQFYDLYLMDVRNRKLKKFWSLPERGIGQVISMSKSLVWSEDYKKIYLYSGFNQPPFTEDLHVAAIGKGMKSPEKTGDHLRNYRAMDTIHGAYIVLSQNKKNLFVLIHFGAASGLRIDVKRIYLPAYNADEFRQIKGKYETTAKGEPLLLLFPVVIGVLLAGLIWKFRSRFVVVPEYPDLVDSSGENHVHQGTSTPAEALQRLLRQTGEKRKTGAGIYLLGDLQLINEAGVNLAPELKGKAREFFLQMILFKYMKEKHLSYQFVHETLWSDFDDARRNNNRKVTMSALRKLLESFPQIEVGTTDHAFSLTITNVYSDLEESILIFNSLASAEPKGLFDERAIELLEKGLLLKTSSYEWLDSFVEQYNTMALDALDRISKRCDEVSPDRLLKLGQLYFEFDQFSETGLQLKIKGYMKGKKPHLAAKEYKTFCAKYEKYFAEGFGMDFDMLAQNPLRYSRD